MAGYGFNMGVTEVAQDWITTGDGPGDGKRDGGAVDGEAGGGDCVAEILRQAGEYRG